jgi:hypothetical protein
MNDGWKGPYFVLRYPRVCLEELRTTTVRCCRVVVPARNLPDSMLEHNYLTQWNGVLLQMLMVAKMVRRFFASYENRKFITLFTTAPYWIVS